MRKRTASKGFKSNSKQKVFLSIEHDEVIDSNLLSIKDKLSYRAIGKFRYAKYARYLMWEYYPAFANLCLDHANALEEKNSVKIKETEAKINEFNAKFFNI